ncbi:hypothetical protein ACF3NT_12080 [Naumannella halotolerans]|uniref:hypothetical protein n=1 Tax=Naumannella halotolerans TaxID=993414 RepID=UPI00370DD2C1
MDLATVIDQVYAVPLEEFTGLRDDLAKQARSSGDRELAKTIKSLRKPTTSAWLVNRWSRANREDVDQLLELAELLAQAHRTLSADDLRTLSRQRTRLINSLTRAVAASSPGTVSAATGNEVGQILTGALTDQALAQRLRTGTVTQAVAASGFGTLDLGAGAEVISLAARQRTAKPGTPKEGRPAQHPANRADEARPGPDAEAQARAEAAERERAEREAEEARRAARNQARELAETAASAVAEARAAVSATEQALLRAESDLQAAQERLAEAQAALESAEATHTALTAQRDRRRESLAVAEQAQADAERTLDDLT